MRRLFHLFACIGMTLSLSACTGEVSEGARGAADAYAAFNEELRKCSQAGSDSCNKDAIWEGMNVQSKTQFYEAYAALNRINRVIETSFDPIEHKYMQSKTGVDILETAGIKEYKDLYLYLFKPENLVFDDNVNSGLQVESDEVKDDNNVIIHTHYAGQNVNMIRESDGVWRSDFLLSSISAALEPIFASEQAMNDYAEENLKAEIKRRKEVCEYFNTQRVILRKQNDEMLRQKLQK